MTVYVYQGRISPNGQSAPMTLRRDEAEERREYRQLKRRWCSSWRGTRNLLEEPTAQGEHQRNEVDLDLLDAGQLLVEDAKL